MGCTLIEIHQSELANFFATRITDFARSPPEINDRDDVVLLVVSHGSSNGVYLLTKRCLDYLMTLREDNLEALESTYLSSVNQRS